jgi:mRNA interferase MazF
MAKTAGIGGLKRGDVYWVSFEPAQGAEIKKTRPALIVQNDVANRYSPITIVAAISSPFDETLYPTEVLVRAPEGGLRSDSVVLLNQIRSIDRQRLVRRLGGLRAETMERVNRALQISLGLARI